MPDVEKTIEELFELDPKEVQSTHVFLDPNNPRFATEKDERTSDEKAIQDKVQEKALERLRKIGIEDLKASMEQHGFLSIDRVVVRPVGDNAFVVVEGNRRIAALKELTLEDSEGEKNLSGKVRESLTEIDVLVYKGDDPEIAWKIQGLRHISGIRNWPPLQQAKFINDMYESAHLSLRETGGPFNLSGRDVAKLIRSYRGYLQAKEHEEYGDLMKPDKFSFFNEAVFQKTSLRDWLGWNDDDWMFHNDANFAKFLGWICPVEGESARVERAVDARDILSKMVTPENAGILSKFESGESSLQEADVEIRNKARTAGELAAEVDLSVVAADMEKLLHKILTLPIPKIRADPKSKAGIRDLLKDIASYANEQLTSIGPD